MSSTNGTLERFNLSTVKLRKSKARKVHRQHKARLTHGDYARAFSFFALAVVGLAVSLPHLASEIALLTGSAAIASWLVAIVIDLGMVACKAHLSADGPAAKVAWSILGACTVVSIVLNCHAFSAHSAGTFGAVAAIGFGMFLPLFIVALSYLGSEILLKRK